MTGWKGFSAACKARTGVPKFLSASARGSAAPPCGKAPPFRDLASDRWLFGEAAPRRLRRSLNLKDKPSTRSGKAKPFRKTERHSRRPQEQVCAPLRIPFVTSGSATSSFTIRPSPFSIQGASCRIRPPRRANRSLRCCKSPLASLLFAPTRRRCAAPRSRAGTCSW